MSSRPHRLWSIAEVVREVMRHNAEEQGTLLQCALVSRSFSEPALEVLWETQEGLSHLLALLPSSFLKVQAVADDDDDEFGYRPSSFVFRDPIRDEEWARAEHYARLVRIYIGDSDRIDGLAVVTLLEQLRGRALFPRLRELKWRRPFEHSAPLALFLSPMLREVRLDLLEGGEARYYYDKHSEPTAADYAYDTALRMIRARAPRVESISLATAAFPCSVNRLSEFESLKSLSLRCVRNPEIILELCVSLSQLTELMVEFSRPSGRTAPSTPPPTHTPRTLPTLEDLYLTGPARLVVPFTEAVHAARLRDISLTFDAKEDWWKRCVELLSSRFSTSLRSVQAVIEDTYEPAETYAFHDWFAALYAIRGLEHVEVVSQFDNEFTVTAKDVEDMAAAWPGVRELALPTVQVRPSSSLPITAFEALAKGCPHLEFLVAPLPHHAPFAGKKFPPSPTPANAVEHLRLFGGSWPVDVRPKCLSYLKKLFPRVRTVFFDEDLDDSGWFI